MHATYENFSAVCPHCGTRNVFNRVSDLHTSKPIDFRTVTCLEGACGRQFSINSDWSSPAHAMLLLDCYGFLERKQFMQCVLTVAQAYEVFFSHFLHVQLLYRPFATDGSHDLPRLNRLAELLYDRIHLLAFEPLRRLFLSLVVENVAPPTLSDAEALLRSLEKRRAVPQEAIEGIPDPGLRDLLLRLDATDVNKLRNRVVHKDAYRPTREEAKSLHEEAEHILHGLTSRLRLQGDGPWYASRAGR
jgi:hypothetical protein